MTGPSLDVIIPVKDAGPFLSQAILSILSQSLLPSRIIVIDDGSVDDTNEIAERFGKKITLVTGPFKGPSAARNLGVLHSDAEFVTFLDADDLFRAGRISMSLDAIEKNRGADIAFCDIEYLSEHGKETGTVVNFPEFRQEAFLGAAF
jgi:glycosyltransferase involved in cell wall biosynthesis